jgi:hypothetical protein
VVIWYIFSHFGILYQEKSGNPGLQQGCQIFLDTIYQNGDNITNGQNHEPNGHKTKADGHAQVYQMVMKDIKIIHMFKGLPKCTKTGGLVWKQTIWQPFRRHLD